MARRFKSIADQLNDVVQTIADELAKPDLKPARVNLLTAQIDTLKYLHQQEQSSLAAENADLKKQIAELKAPSTPSQTTPQSDLDLQVEAMLRRHNASQPAAAIVTVPPSMTRSEPVVPRPVEYDEDLVT
jgi:hypothetical protein